MTIDVPPAVWVRCPKCNNLVRVRQRGEGTLWKHLAKAGDNDWCPWSGRFPTEDCHARVDPPCQHRAWANGYCGTHQPDPAMKAVYEGRPQP